MAGTKVEIAWGLCFGFGFVLDVEEEKVEAGDRAMLMSLVVDRVLDFDLVFGLPDKDEVEDSDVDEDLCLRGDRDGGGDAATNCLCII
jgi:hypothetical protein